MPDEKPDYVETLFQRTFSPRPPLSRVDDNTMLYDSKLSIDLSAFIGPPVGEERDIYFKKLGYFDGKFDYPPRCIYLYYITMSGGTNMSVRHYFYSKGPEGTANPDHIDDAELKARIQDMATLAAKGDEGPPGTNIRKDGTNFQNLAWKHRSYLVFVLDEQDWEFYTWRGKDQPEADRYAVMFNTYRDKADNHSFFDARDDITVKLPNRFPGDPEVIRPTLCLINHMTEDDDGNVLGRTPGGKLREQFVFDLYLKNYLAGKNSEPLAIILDPGSENQGPPMEP